MRREARYRYKRPVKGRFVAAFFLVLLCFSFLSARLFFLQVLKHPHYRSIVAGNRTAVIPLPSVRGAILDRNLNELASNISRYSVYAVPSYISRKESAAENIAKLFNKNKAEVLDRISGDKMFAWIARKLPDDEIRKIRDREVEGIGFVAENERIYPDGTLAAHVIGFVDIDNNGLEGIEKYYDAELRGTAGYKVVAVDAKRRQVGSASDRFIPARNGYNIVLTIDGVIQHVAEKALLAGVEKFHPMSASVVVMDPSEGEILAMCNWPSYDLNNCSDASADARRNRAVTDILEPGSAFKIVTASAVLEEQAVSLDEEFYCEEGSYNIAGRVLHDHRPHGTLRFKDVIKVSSNIGTVKSAQKLGEEKLYKYTKRFGFGLETGVDLPGEVGGTVRHVSKWSKGSIAAVPIGQEIAVTAIQLAAAISCIANDGLFLKPRVVKKMIDSNNAVIKEFEAEPVRRVISKETSFKVKEVLRAVIEDGTGKKASVAGYSAAGKTGTAQITESDGSYSHSKFNAVFIGFAPVDDPKLAIAVVFVEPRPYYYGGTVAAPVFSEIAEKVLRYMGVPPSKDASLSTM